MALSSSAREEETQKREDDMYLTQGLHRCVQRSPDRVTITFGERSETCGELQGRVAPAGTLSFEALIAGGAPVDDAFCVGNDLAWFTAIQARADRLMHTCACSRWQTPARP
ncbi:hypothetical protein [Caballeronia ptereochthonis]|uniref:hypothetical protein n=1 Tax=Caballeronia ptereochthonis TaxID=1777144 RepID=UPI000AF71F18|nr:hypothetical protein [Caballeronia ptereochthonis]